MNDLTISKLQTVLPSANAPDNKSAEASTAPFSDFVQRSLADVNRQMLDADESVGDLATGRNQDIHNTMIAMQKAEISFELVMQVRNKLISAYDEIRRMSI
ncbi:flagellar hook-basal body complex protein FliE [Desulfosarcina alkanivorans]|jgi:flagellar hook-basal body complex protein FliE|uniref:Flagellar hook-basal body complex protein FliE n=1 Tax=Desulfosarcina alkanivorans TaxID=571177 RepID=A0A5K7YQ63_9BACT|nr:flagellar hook-basal body complex protein FliE [Desulfosarcina alkanivorans]BBO66757.1 flagellar hook-basal body complex protein FliE [Desulfosarcina alkanivorans]